MNNNKLEAKVETAFSHAAPDILDSVLSDCEKQKGKVIIMNETRNYNSRIMRFAGIAAAFFILLAGVTGFFIYSYNYAVSSTVSLDVNPSIEIQLNKNERVLAVNALNEDGREIIGEMDFKGSDLEVALNAIIGSMLKNGYISEISNSILISVDNGDSAKGRALQEKLSSEISALLQTDAFTGAVLSQTVSADSALQKLADTHGISFGKAQLIQKIVSKNTLYTFEDLVDLSINELNLLSSSGKTVLDKVESVGTASDKAYIGAEKAKEAAFSHAGIASADVSDIEVELDYDDGVMLYEVDFKYAGFEYDYDINAVTGAVVKSSKEYDDDISGNKNNDAAGTPVTEDYISTAEARSIALAHAGVSENDIRDYDIDLDRENGLSVYKIDFESGSYEYSYKINAETGAIVKNGKESDNDSSISSAAAGNYIGTEQAKKIALNHSGVPADSIYDYSIELDKDNGIMIYEVEYCADGIEYKYDINAEAGTVIRFEKESDD